jgi:hypothetical protein
MSVGNHARGDRKRRLSRVPSLRQVYRDECDAHLNRFDWLPAPLRRRIILFTVLAGMLCLALAVFAAVVILDVPDLAAANATASGAYAGEGEHGGEHGGTGGQVPLVLASGTIGVDRDNSGLYIASPIVGGVRAIVLELDRQYDALVGTLRALTGTRCVVRLPNGDLVTAKPGATVPILAVSLPNGLLPLAASPIAGPGSCLIANPSLRRAATTAVGPSPTHKAEVARSFNDGAVTQPEPAEPHSSDNADIQTCYPLIDLQVLEVLPCK